MYCILIAGMPATGKSTLAEKLSAWAKVNVDAIIRWVRDHSTSLA